jgi:hypothetical protein
MVLCSEKRNGVKNFLALSSLYTFADNKTIQHKKHIMSFYYFQHEFAFLHKTAN